ncbi:hypothetical protein B0H13DRAFT_1625075, partial [Mycena leptocephala]
MQYNEDDSPFSRFCAHNARIWKLYMKKVFDENRATTINRDLDSLLIFVRIDDLKTLRAGLFSAILSAFLIEIRKGLKEDSSSITNSLLATLIQAQNSTNPQVSSDTPFVPMASTLWIIGLWFMSLVLSLNSALWATMAKGWLTNISTASNWVNVSLHFEHFDGTDQSFLTFTIQSLPVLIHLAVLLFSAGLVILLFHDDRAIGITTLICTAIAGAVYLCSSIL